MSAVLRLDGVRAGYGRLEVLHGIDLEVEAGTTVALLGANGAGKSTTLRVAAGLVPPSGGQVLLDGAPVGSRRANRRSRQGLCFIPEGRGVFQHLTVRQNLAMQVGGRRRLPEALGIMATHFPVLADRLDQRAGTLSGGEQQMLAVTRALVTSPSLVMADELSVGLAPVIVDQILAAVTALRRQGSALLIVEQYVDRVLDIADAVVILHQGAVVHAGPAEGARDDVFERYLGAAGAGAGSPGARS
jgi:branched-chain amino acid transport system ATP-binding protein